MPRLSFGVFLWLFAIGNAVVWFGIVFGMTHVIARGLSPAGDLARASALWIVGIVPLFANVLAAQGSIVNLRVQYLDGRFDLPRSAAGASPAALRDPWRVALRIGWLLYLTGVPLAILVAYLAFPETVRVRDTGMLLGAVVASSVLIATHWASAPELRSFATRLGQTIEAPQPLRPYLFTRLALPWGLINLVLNGILAGVALSHAAGDAAPLTVLRRDLVGLSVALSFLIGLAAVPEAECDAVTGAVELPRRGATMPSFLQRLGMVAATAATVWLGITIAGLATGTDHVAVRTAIAAEALFAGLLAGASAWLHGRWGLARCHTKHRQWVAATEIDGTRGSSNQDPVTGTHG